jgi:hypothetical protein
MSLREDAKKIYSSSIAKLDPSRTVYDYLSSHSIVKPHVLKKFILLHLGKHPYP